jgi:hypothetical protein
MNLDRIKAKPRSGVWFGKKETDKTAVKPREESLLCTLFPLSLSLFLFVLFFPCSCLYLSHVIPLSRFVCISSSLFCVFFFFFS